VFLYNSTSGAIFAHLVLYNGATVPTFGTDQYTFAEITNNYDVGTTYEDDYVVVVNVPTATNRCMVVLNAFDEDGDPLITETQSNINTLVTTLTATANTFNRDATINNVALVADAAIATVSGTGGETGDVPYTRMANMNVGAIGTRVQVGQLSTHDTDDGDKITSYEVGGVYINMFYPSMMLTPDIANSNAIRYGTATLVDNGKTEAGYTPANYTGANASLAITGPWTSSGASAVTVPAAGDYWVFNLVPNGGIPHIVIEIKNIVRQLNGVNYPAETGSKWLTIQKYIENAEEVGSFLANHVYTLADVSFDYDNLTEEPYGQNENVAVHVTVTDWTNHNVTWE
jgi:hypothetical protein